MESWLDVSTDKMNPGSLKVTAKDFLAQAQQWAKTHNIYFSFFFGFESDVEKKKRIHQDEKGMHDIEQRPPAEIKSWC